MFHAFAFESEILMENIPFEEGKEILNLKNYDELGLRFVCMLLRVKSTV